MREDLKDRNWKGPYAVSNWIPGFIRTPPKKKSKYFVSSLKEDAPLKKDPPLKGGRPLVNTVLRMNVR